MWTRKEVRKKGKWAFKRNYWKAVVVGLLFTMMAGGFTYSQSYSNINSKNEEQITEQTKENLFSIIGEKELQESGLSDKEIEEIEEVLKPSEGAGIEDDVVNVVSVIVGVIVVLIVVAIIVGLSLLINAFLLNPVVVGANGFFLKNIYRNENVKSMLSVFDSEHYKNVVKTMFLRDIYTILWFLLFIIPGIIKTYEYSMIPYLLAEHPEMTTEEAFAESKRLMKGNKWRAFKLDFSFIGWHILSLFTAGILSIFYVTPYKLSTNAVLYETLKYGNGDVVYSQIDTQE